jgi:hypothetical protein
MLKELGSVKLLHRVTIWHQSFRLICQHGRKKNIEYNKYTKDNTAILIALLMFRNFRLFVLNDFFRSTSSFTFLKQVSFIDWRWCDFQKMGEIFNQTQKENVSLIVNG